MALMCRANQNYTRYTRAKKKGAYVGRKGTCGIIYFILQFDYIMPRLDVKN